MSASLWLLLVTIVACAHAASQGNSNGLQSFFGGTIDGYWIDGLTVADGTPSVYWSCMGMCTCCPGPGWFCGGGQPYDSGCYAGASISGASASATAGSGGCTTGDDNIYQQFKDNFGSDYIKEYKGQLTIPANPTSASGNDHTEWVYQGIKNNVDPVRPKGAVIALWGQMTATSGTTLGTANAWSVYSYIQVDYATDRIVVASAPLSGVSAGSVVNVTIVYDASGLLTVDAQLSSGGSISRAALDSFYTGFNLVQNVVSHCGSTNCDQWPGTSASSGNALEKAKFSNLSAKKCSGTNCSSSSSKTLSFDHANPGGTTCGAAYDSPSSTETKLGPW